MNRMIACSVGFIVLGCVLDQTGLAQDKASPQELVQKVQEAAASLAKSGESGVAAFNTKSAPWVWKDTFVVVLDCGKGIMAANPIKPELVGKPLASLKDAKGNPAFELLCAAAKSPNGVWAEWAVPKPGEKDPSRKVSYGYAAKGTDYVVGAGVFDPQAQISDLEKLSTK